MLLERVDYRIWRWDYNGSFTVKSFYTFFNDGGIRSSLNKSLWKEDCPLKIKIFNWLVLDNKILTLDNLAKRAIEFSLQLVCFAMRQWKLWITCSWHTLLQLESGCNTLPLLISLVCPLTGRRHGLTGPSTESPILMTWETSLFVRFVEYLAWMEQLNFLMRIIFFLIVYL